MQKLHFFFFLIFFPSLLFAQQRTKIVVKDSEVATVNNKTKITHIKKPIFEHDGAILTCDSARLWGELNYFEAFGNVHINQDTINIYSDLLNYDGNAKMAHLINKVRMSDPSTLLTTNIFDYNMATRVGTYIDNGKIVNRQENVTITSKRGYYLASTKDAYFKYNVVVLTDSATIKSDTLRYNTFTNQTYFYGPTDIKGKNDNLYTENGTYNTKTKKAFFGKKNLYTQNTKSLKGDSLFYDGMKGYGRAVKNIVFNDTEDKLMLRGQLGEYFKEGERIIASINAYVGLGTSDSVTVDGKLIPDTLWLGADVLEAERSLQKKINLIQTPKVLDDDEIGMEDEKSKAQTQGASKATIPSNTTPNTPIVKPNPKLSPKQSKKDKAKEKKEQKNKTLLPDSAKTVIDSVKILTDSTKLNLKITAKKDSLSKDSLAKIPKPLIKDSTKITAPKVTLKTDTLKNTAKKTIVAPLTKPIVVKDSIPFNPADTVRTRTIRAYHNVRVYKTNLQAKSDSLFFAAADSTLRLYQNPILWSDSSQQTGDTIHVQFKNKKINNAQVFPNAFIVNQESDTTKFNQIKGKVVTAFFNDGEIRNLYVDGNAESIYFDKKEDGDYQQNQTISARIRVIFAEKEISSVKTIKAVEGTFLPAGKTPKEAMLTGFIWKPELRPKSKNDIIKGLPSKTGTTKPKVAPKPNAKTTTKKPATKPAVKTSLKKTTGNTTKDNKIPVKIDSAKNNPKPIAPILVPDTSKKN